MGFGPESHRQNRKSKSIERRTNTVLVFVFSQDNKYIECLKPSLLMSFHVMCVFSFLVPPAHAQHRKLEAQEVTTGGGICHVGPAVHMVCPSHP